MRSQSNRLTYNNDTAFEAFLSSYIDENEKSFDYEYSSALGVYIIYFHYDSNFSRNKILLDYIDYITEVSNYRIKNNPSDLSDFFVTSNNQPPGEEWLNWILWEGIYYKNLNLASLKGQITAGKTIYSFEEIFQMSIEDTIALIINKILNK